VSALLRAAVGPPEGEKGKDLSRGLQFFPFSPLDAEEGRKQIIPDFVKLTKGQGSQQPCPFKACIPTPRLHTHGTYLATCFLLLPGAPGGQSPSNLIHVFDLAGDDRAGIFLGLLQGAERVQRVDRGKQSFVGEKKVMEKARCLFYVYDAYNERLVMYHLSGMQPKTKTTNRTLLSSFDF